MSEDTKNRPNFASRTVWTGDNLDILRGINSECVDLIYLDPPFNSNQDYSAPIGSKAAGAHFKDTWTLDDVDAAWHGEIADRDPPLYSVIDAAGLAHSPSMKSYLIMMAVRLLEMRRVLKPTGSIYLHCDPTASHYLRTVMDAVLGRTNFRNELVWKRTSSHSDAGRYARVSDRILLYASKGATWNPQHLPLGKTYVDRDYRHRDTRGRYRVGDLTASGTRTGESGEPWRGYDPGSAGRHWGIPKQGGYARWLEDNLIPGYRSIPRGHDRLDALEAAGLIDWTPSGYPRLKRYLAASKGEAVSDFIADVQNVNNRSKEHMGYPTQKPLKLLDRLIRASSNPGDMVLDPFCGCATALVAAESLGRQWAGIDLSTLAVRLVDQRLRDQHGVFGQIIDRTDVPSRTDLGMLPNYRTHRHTLYGRQEGHCTGCRVHFPFRNLTVDHIVPQSKGGSDHLDNLQLLCGACNSKKGNRSMEALIADLLTEGIRR